MSKLITNTVRHRDGSADNITLDSSKNVTCENNLQVDGNLTVTGTIPADKLTGTAAAINGSNITNLPAANLTGALPAISGASLTGITSQDTLSFRRLNINGAMAVAQRGTSASLTGNNNSQDAYRVVDRYLMGCRSDAVWTYSQESDGPSGFAKSFKALCTTADSSVAANVYEQFVHTFEGQDVQLLKQGTSDAVSVTISFWVKSNKTGTYILEIRDLDNNRHNSKSYTISSSATWEKKTITYSGDTTGALDNDNAASFRVYWWLAAGSDKSSGTLATSWAATNEANRAVGQVQLTDTANNYWQITGVQIEVGTTATDFEYRSYAEELWRCQRYYQLGRRNEGEGISSSQVDMNPVLSPEMRTNPSTGQQGVAAMNGGNADKTQTSTGLSDYGGDETGKFIRLDNFSSLNTWQTYRWKYSNDNKLTFDAEL